VKGRRRYWSGAKRQGLSPRQVDVMQCLGYGMETGEIQEVLGIAEKTVAEHLAKLQSIFNCSTRYLIRIAMAFGMAPLCVALLAAAQPPVVPLAVPIASTTTLAWDAYTNQPITGFRLYQGVASRSYTNSVFLPVGTTGTISSIPGITNFFAVTAVATNGESKFSNEAVSIPSVTGTNFIHLHAFAEMKLNGQWIRVTNYPTVTITNPLPAVYRSGITIVNSTTP